MFPYNVNIRCLSWENLSVVYGKKHHGRCLIVWDNVHQPITQSNFMELKSVVCHTGQMNTATFTETSEFLNETQNQCTCTEGRLQMKFQIKHNYQTKMGSLFI